MTSTMLVSRSTGRPPTPRAGRRRNPPRDRRRRGKTGRAPPARKGPRRRPRRQHEHRASCAPAAARRRPARVPPRPRHLRRPARPSGRGPAQARRSSSTRPPARLPRRRADPDHRGRGLAGCDQQRTRMPCHQAGWPRPLPSMSKQLRRERLFGETGAIARATRSQSESSTITSARSTRYGSIRRSALELLLVLVAVVVVVDAGAAALEHTGAERVEGVALDQHRPAREIEALQVRLELLTLPSRNEKSSIATKSRPSFPNIAEIEASTRGRCRSRRSSRPSESNARRGSAARGCSRAQDRAPPRGLARNAGRAGARFRGTRRRLQAARSRNASVFTGGWCLTPLRRERRTRASRRRARQACGPPAVSWYSTRGGRVSKTLRSSTPAFSSSTRRRASVPAGYPRAPA